MPQVANNQKSTTPESDAHSIHVQIVREGVCTHLQRNLEKDSQSRITRGWNLRTLPSLGKPHLEVEILNKRAVPGEGTYYLFTVQREMVALDQVHI